jgi:hypothetical protein
LKSYLLGMLGLMYRQHGVRTHASCPKWKQKDPLRVLAGSVDYQMTSRRAAKAESVILIV